MLENKLVLIKGAGDFASGSIRRLHLAGCKVAATEIDKPLAVRRMVAFSEAVFKGETTVEGVTAKMVEKSGIDRALAAGRVAVLVDPETTILKERDFDIVVDARSAKRNMGTSMDEAPVVIGIGPGFRAGRDCHALVESLAGHDLGRVIYSGAAAPDTGKPAPPEYYLLASACQAASHAAGQTISQTACQAACEPCCAGGFEPEDLVLRSPADGVFRAGAEIGDIVARGDLLGRVGDASVPATAGGVLRGLIHDGVPVTRGLKIGDIDPTGVVERCHTISEKANAIAGGVLEACLVLTRENRRGGSR